MTPPDRGYVDLNEGDARPADLVARVMAGELFVLRRCMQRIGLLEELRAASLEGVRRVAGAEVTAKVDAEGFDQIHRHVGLEEIAAITDEIYRVTAPHAHRWVARIMPDVLGVPHPYYFERRPNIRFVVPYDRMMEDAAFLARFTKRHGRGKITLHPPHRDSWVDCPANTINVWIAVGPVPEGNGITIFPDAFTRDLAHLPSGGLAQHEHPGVPVNFDLAAGDVILFQGDHLHASVLNRTSATRHAVSFRVVVEKPRYLDKHYHHYAYSFLAGGPLDPLAEVPANLTWGWLKTRLGFAAERLGLAGRTARPVHRAVRSEKRWGDERTIDLSRLPANSVQPVSDDVCVARFGDDTVVAVGRRCPHEGADLAMGYVRDGEIVCPWHDLRFDPESGASACRSLTPLRRFPTRVTDGTVTVDLEPGVDPSPGSVPSRHRAP